MPELPEVEIVRRGLEPILTGATIAALDQRRPDLRFPFPDDFEKRVTGQTITAVDRRAKYLLIKLSGGEVLIVHLGMSGRLSVCDCKTGATELTFGDYIYDTGADAKHDHLVITLSSGTQITYNDPRRFGFMLLVPDTDLDVHPMFAALGVEPLGNHFDARYLATKARGKRVDLKAFLLDQRTVAGLGNIYVSEALHRAGLSPKRLASTLAKADGAPSERAIRLVPEIRRVLQAAIDAGGSSLKDYRHTDGTQGTFQIAFAVYGRTDEPCLKTDCRGSIQRMVQASRATFYCSSCQR